ncbi:MAG: hypothetical protein ABH858_06885, partial [Candidatus Omnitrophota bacterium]
LQIWAETGLLGILSWLIIIFWFIKNNLINLGDKNDYRLGLFLSGIAFLLHNIIDYGFFIPQAAFLWWIVLGLSMSAYEKA